jgi:hypothetical protein
LAGIAQQNEMNINTIATSVTDDHWGGLNEVLCGSCYTGEDSYILPKDSIAAEINQIVQGGHLPASDRIPVETPAKVVGCFDLVAARGIRGGRGRCATHVEATTSVQRFSIPPITDETTWDEAELIMRNIFPFLKNQQMRSDSHTPPEAFDFTKGSWKCRRKDCCVEFKSWDEYLVARRECNKQRADKSDEGKKATQKRATAYALLHPSQQCEFQPPATDLDMKDIIVDPLHDLMLNLPKVIWKYCFGDRMTNAQRELVAEYLLSIGCPLDVRNKNDGRDANKKWFTGEAFAYFCEGSDTSPGLAEN